MEEERGMFEGGTTTVAPSNCVCSCQWLEVCVCCQIGGGTATIAILNRECVLMSMLGGGATTISTLKCVCAPVNAWRWHSDNLHLELCVCFCQCLSPP